MGTQKSMLPIPLFEDWQNVHSFNSSFELRWMRICSFRLILFKLRILSNYFKMNSQLTSISALNLTSSFRWHEIRCLPAIPSEQLQGSVASISWRWRKHGHGTQRESCKFTRLSQSVIVFFCSPLRLFVCLFTLYHLTLATVIGTAHSTTSSVCYKGHGVQHTYV